MIDETIRIWNYASLNNLCHDLYIIMTVTDLFYFTALFMLTKYKSFIITFQEKKRRKREVLLLKKNKINFVAKNLHCFTKNEKQDLSIVLKPTKNYLLFYCLNYKELKIKYTVPKFYKHTLFFSRCSKRYF